MGSQLRKLYSGLLYEVVYIVGHYCRKWCEHNIRLLWLDLSLGPILNYFFNEHFKPNLLDPMDPVSSKRFQSTVAVANNEVI